MSASRFIVNRRPDFEGEPDASQANQLEQQLGSVLQGSILPFVQEGIGTGSSRKATCYTGTAGIAYALWQLHTTLQANPSIAIPGSTAVGLSTSVVPKMIELADLALAQVAQGMHPARMVSLLDGAAGVYMTGALVHSAAAHLSSLSHSPPLSATRTAPPAGPEVPAPSLLQQQLQQQGTVPGLLQPQQHWEMCRQCVQAFASCEQYAMQSDSDEVLYGRAGFLMGAIILHTRLSRAADEGTRVLAQPLMEGARQVALAMLDSGRSGATMIRANPQPPLFYVWPAGAGGKPYLGAAHGLIGILHAMLHCPPLLQDPGAAMDIKAGLRYVLAHEQDLPGAPKGSGGHYPTQMGDFKTDRALVHWCHGAPGAAMLFCKAHEVFGGGGEGAAYLPAACRAGEVVWSRGLLRKGPGLCHGVAGNGFVLERLWKAGAGTKWLHRAQQFGLSLGDPEVQETFVNPDNPYSLFQGASAGISYLADLLTLTNAQHHHIAQGGTDAGPLKPQSAPHTLGFPLYDA